MTNPPIQESQSSVLDAVLKMNGEFTRAISAIETREAAHREEYEAWQGTIILQISNLRKEFATELERRIGKSDKPITDRLDALEASTAAVNRWIEQEQQDRAERMRIAERQKIKDDERARVMTEIKETQEQEAIAKQKALDNIAKSQQTQTQLVITLLSSIAIGIIMLLVTRLSTAADTRAIFITGAILIVVVAVLIFTAMRKPHLPKNYVVPPPEHKQGGVL